MKCGPRRQLPSGLAIPAAIILLLAGFVGSASVYRSDASESRSPDGPMSSFHVEDDEAFVEDAASAKMTEGGGDEEGLKKLPFFYATASAVAPEEGQSAGEEEAKPSGGKDDYSDAGGDDNEELSREDLVRMITEVVSELENPLERSGYPLSSFWNPMLPPGPELYPTYGGGGPTHAAPMGGYSLPQPPAFGDLIDPFLHPYSVADSFLPPPNKYSDVCPPCNCHYRPEDVTLRHGIDEMDDEDLVDDDYGFEYDPTYRYNLGGRSKRSVDDYWSSITPPSKHLEKYNVGYRIKNDLRKRIPNSRYWPLHFGHIYTGHTGSDSSTKDVIDRAFGRDADFDFPVDSKHFVSKPKGPRLDKKWMQQGYPTYIFSMYKVLTPLDVMQVVATAGGFVPTGSPVRVKTGVYKIVAIIRGQMTAAGNKNFVIIASVRTGKLFQFEASNANLGKLQALLPLRDPNEKKINATGRPAAMGMLTNIVATPYQGRL